MVNKLVGPIALAPFVRIAMWMVIFVTRDAFPRGIPGYIRVAPFQMLTPFAGVTGGMTLIRPTSIRNPRTSDCVDTAALGNAEKAISDGICRIRSPVA